MQILQYKNLTSTNSFALELAEKQAPEWTVIVAEQQQQGQGRMARVWESEHGGLWFSVILRPQLASEFAPQATLLAAVAVTKALRELYATPTVVIKWPNDLLIAKKKICGILSELRLTAQGEIDYLVVGIGVNVLQENFSDNIQTVASSLLLETGKRYTCAKVLDRILQYFQEYYQEWLENGFENLRSNWLQYNCTLGKFITVKDEERIIFQGIAEDMDDYGSLLVTNAKGEQNTFNFGEISIRS